MNVLVIPEDFRKDQYMLKPIIAAMMKELLSEEAARRYDRIRQLCPEDIVVLENKISAFVEASA